MDLEKKIMEDIKTAMKAKDKEKLEALRAVKSAILLAKTDKGSKEMDEVFEINLLQKLVKQRKDSATIYNQQKRQDLYEKEIMEAEIISNYLPKQISDEELQEVISKIIHNSEAKSMADMGKVMGLASKELSGKADGKRISEIVKKSLMQ
ncbi:MAG: GatB/YqeY domain-containing protein [Bacteroidales bacterium]|nr:GatB/YqeY domain-containing protein [Bacteroidales bacterium]